MTSGVSVTRRPANAWDLSVGASGNAGAEKKVEPHGSVSQDQSQFTIQRVFMCCFSRPVIVVSATNIFARPAEGGRQFLIYSMNLKARRCL
jgi:hypothetical protein